MSLILGPDGLPLVTEEEVKLREKGFFTGPRATFEVPWCEVCNKPVEKFYQEKVPPDKIALIAECHGSTSDVVMPEMLLWRLDAKSAFTDKRRMTISGRLLKRFMKRRDPWNIW